MLTEHLLNRFIKFVRFSESGCWEWSGALFENGYGAFQLFSTTTRRAHRVSYMLLAGPIPDGLTLDHLCRNRTCVNPDHLEPVTMRVNSLRGTSVSALKAKQTVCVKGHSFDYRSDGRRQCRICKNAYRRRWRLDRKAKGLLPYA